MDTSKTVRVTVHNTSTRGKVLRTHGGTVEVPANTRRDVDILPLTDQQVEDYRVDHGLIIGPAGEQPEVAPESKRARKPKGSKRDQEDLLA
jgi:hypothetical protein